MSLGIIPPRKRDETQPYQVRRKASGGPLTDTEKAQQVLGRHWARMGARGGPRELTASLLGSMTDFPVPFGPEGAQSFQVQKTLSLRTQTWLL